jgi:hypothetical protein
MPGNIDAFFATIASSDLTSPKPAPSSPPVITSKLVPGNVEYKAVLGVVVCIADFSLSHPKMAQIGDRDLKMDESRVVEHAKKVKDC